ncbi:MAG: HAMP domain-containing histidine kinase, partial [Pedobacter sp.]
MLIFVKLVYNELIGDKPSTSLQARIFHHVCLIALMIIPISIFINILTAIPHVSLALLGAFIVTGFCYYNSRYGGHLKTSSIVFISTLHLLLIANYYFNSGINGTTLILFMVSLVLTIAIMPRKQYKIWIPVNIGCALVLISHEFIFRDAVTHTYSGRTNFFIDQGFTYLASSAFIAAVFTYLLKSYREEKNKAWAASNALKEANDAKTKLLSILSHDLNSPLNSITGFLELLIDVDFNEEERMTIKQSLLKETKNTQAMLQNLLSWTKSQMDGGIHITLKPVNILNTLKETIENLQNVAREKMISIDYHIDREVCIVADVDMLKLIVRNLLNNSIKFTRPGGEIKVKVVINTADASLQIEDNGIGISLEKQQQLFSLNTRSTYGTRNEKGIGLGLLLCKEFTE